MAMFKFLANHIEYPKYCADRYIQGRVVVQFIVRENGMVDSVCVESPGFPLMDKEAVRVVRALYRFEPATKGGAPVKSTFKVPITFKIQTSGFFFDPLDLFEKNIRQGVKYSREKDYYLAERNFKDALGIIPIRYDVVNYCDSILEGTDRQFGFREWVANMLQKEVELYPETSSFYTPKIIEIREKALRQNPDDLKMLYGMQRARLFNGDYSEAIALGNRLLDSISPETDGYMYSRVLANQIKAKLNAFDYQGVVDLFGHDAQTLFLKYRTSKTPLKDLNFSEYFEKKSEQIRFEPMYDLAEAYAQLGRVDDAKNVIGTLKYYLKGSFKANTHKVWSKKPGMLNLAGLWRKN